MKPDSAIILILEAHFEIMPSNEELTDILELIRGTGIIRKATLTITAPLERDLLKEL